MDIEDIYYLTPLQEGMLYHRLAEPRSEAYFQQLRCSLRGKLEVEALKWTWEQLVARHEVLRTSFVWEEVDRPVQVVQRRVELPWREFDWRGIPAEVRAGRLEAWLVADRGDGFDVTQAPLMRVTLIREEDELYQFVWSHHHLLIDGWGSSVLFAELLGLYEERTKGKAVKRAQPRPYRDYVEWIERQDKEAAAKYWREALQGVEWEGERVNGSGEGRGFGEERLRLGDAVAEKLGEFCRAQQVTLNTVVQGAWGLLHARQSGRREAVFGAVVSGRPAELEGSEKMVGLFINTLPVRVRVREEEEAWRWLRGLQEEQAEARQYEYSPLTEVQRWARVPGGVGLFDSVVVFENYPTASGAGTEIQEAHVEVSEMRTVERSNYPLTLAVVPGLQPELRLGYEGGKYSRSEARQILESLGRLLEGLAEDPLTTVANLSLISKEERQKLVYDWNDTSEAYVESGLCLHELFEQQATRTPNQIALECGEQKLSYAELNARANQLANRLRGMGVGPERLVALCMERSAQMVIALLGILKAGGAYVPLDPEYPRERLRFMLEDCGVDVVLTQRSVADRLPEYGGRVWNLDDEWESTGEVAETGARVGPVTANLAYVLYTSGSTGLPKGAMLSHRGVVNCLLWMQQIYNLDESDSFLFKTSLNFDPSVWEIFWTLATGGRIVIAPAGAEGDAAALLDLIERREVTTAYFVPSMLRAVVAHAGQGGRPRALSLKRVICGGEALSKTLLEEYRDVIGAELHHSYGPTETSIASSEWCAAEVATDIVPIGRPIANTQLYVLDEWMELCPTGVAGELYIGGEGLGRGYLNRADLTAERFVPDPFGEAGSRLYRTGDVVKYLSDGNVQFVGRVDHQVKVRGHRIELGEIEAALSSHAEVRQCVVAVVEREHRQLVAYVVTAGEKDGSDGAAELSKAWRQHLLECLPDYMVPNAFVVLDQMPLMPNGKVDRRSLPSLDQSSQPVSTRYLEPRTPTEQLLAGIWSEVLGRRQVGIDDNFFELGGDSILSLQIAAKANQSGLHVRPGHIFEYPTVAELAIAGSKSVQEVSQKQVTGYVPLTPIQYLFFEQNLPEPYHFNQAVMLKAQRFLDRELLLQAVEHLLAHHDALRMRFQHGESGWRQFNADVETNVVFVYYDLSHLSDDAQAAAIKAATIQAHTGLNLENGPLIRVLLIDCGSNKPQHLLLVIHHLVVDGVSWRILLEDLQTLYGQLSAGERVQLPAKTTSFQEWSRKLEAYAQSEEVRQEESYWLNAKESARLPADYEGGENLEGTARTLTVELSEAETRTLLQEVLKAYHAQINEVLLAAVSRSLLRWAGGNRLLVEMEGHGREEIGAAVDVSRTVGWFTTLFPVLLEVEAEQEAGEAVKQVKEQLRSLPQRGIGYGLLKYLSGSEAWRDAEQVAEVSFNYLGQFDGTLQADSIFRVAEESSGRSRSELGPRQHLLSLNGSVAGGRLTMGWTYSSAVHREETIRRVAEWFIDDLRDLISKRRAVDHGSYTPSDFPLATITQEVLDRLLARNTEIEDIYYLTPLQEGMLYQRLAQPRSEAYFQQLRCSLRGKLEVEALKWAWEQLVARHEVLRTSFVWEEVDRPVQVVQRRVELPWRELDWCGIAPEIRAERLESLMAADRADGFDVTQAPLMRMTLIREEDELYQFVWSHHHLLIDGWGSSVLFAELLGMYDERTRGIDVKRPRPRRYRDYVEWLENQDKEAAAKYWRTALEGVAWEELSGKGEVAGSGWAEARLRLGDAVAEKLGEFCRQHQVTLNTVIQGVWGLLLARQSGRRDVVFGSVVSGRPVELSGAEKMVGLFINTLPVRVQLREDEEVWRWLQRLQEEQTEARQYEYSPLVEVQRWAGVPGGVGLFDSVIVFENYPVGGGEGAVRREVGVELEEVATVERTNYPLTLGVVPERELELRIIYEVGKYSLTEVRRMLDSLSRLLVGLADDPLTPVVNLSDISEAETLEMSRSFNEDLEAE